jgi:hypothetical protein
MLEFRLARIEWTTSGETTTTTNITPPLDLIEYIPSAAPVDVDWTPGRGVGSWPVAHRVDNVTETLVLSARCDAPGYLRTLNAALARARHWAQGFRRDMRTVLQVRDNNRHESDEWYEARIYGGRVAFEDGMGKTLRMTFVREPYWHGEEAICQVANTSTDWAFEDTCGIYNHDDDMPDHNNWVLVDAPDGDVPTPAMITIWNTYDDDRLKKITIGWMDRPALLALEGEDADHATLNTGTEYSGAAIGADSSYTWEIANTGLVDYVGMYRVLAQGNLSGATWSLSVGYELTKQQQLSAVDGERGWTDLGQVILPPGGYTHPTRYNMKVWLDGSAEGALDFLAFVPMQQYRVLEFQGYNALPGTCIEDNGIRDELVYRFGDERMPILRSWGQPIHLWPDGMLPQALPGPTPPNEQMMVFALEDDGGGAEALRTATIAVRARPRYEILP